jgi:hypothetical protein
MKGYIEINVTLAAAYLAYYITQVWIEIFDKCPVLDQSPEYEYDLIQARLSSLYFWAPSYSLV